MPLPELQVAGLFVHLALLSDALSGHLNVRLVIHSSWRLTHSDDDLKQLLGPLAGRVDGATDRQLDRQLSIVELLGQLSEVVIACDPRGLASPSALRQLTAWLKGS